MTALYLILLVLAAACFLASAFGRNRSVGRVDLFPLGLFFWVLVPLIQTFQTIGD